MSLTKYLFFVIVAGKSVSLVVTIRNQVSQMGLSMQKPGIRDGSLLSRVRSKARIGPIAEWGGTLLFGPKQEPPSSSETGFLLRAKEKGRGLLLVFGQTRNPPPSLPFFRSTRVSRRFRSRQ